MAERFKAPVLKTGVRESVPWVRIPPLPPAVPPPTLSGQRQSLAQFQQKVQPNGLARSTESSYTDGSNGVVAQLGERRNRTAEVEGSTPFDSTK